MLRSRGVLPRGAWAASVRGVHAPRKFPPAPLGKCDVPSRQGSTVLADRVQEDEKVARAVIEDANEVAPCMAAQLSQAAFDLRGPGKRQRREVVRKTVQFSDLAFDGPPFSVGEFRAEEFADGLAAVGVSVEDRLGWHPSLRGRVGWILPTRLSSSLQVAR
jgi:hypothetical protein